jgi:hypothetical protein
MHATIGGCAPTISMLSTSLLGTISYTFLIFPHTQTPDTHFRGVSLTGVLENCKLTELNYRFHYKKNETPLTFGETKFCQLNPFVFRK